MTLDEFEAIRLADLEGMYQEHAAAGMHISRQTFGRILYSAHRKTAEALIKGKALRIEGGKIEVAAIKDFKCAGCDYTWASPTGSKETVECPKCNYKNINKCCRKRRNTEEQK